MKKHLLFLSLLLTGLFATASAAERIQFFENVHEVSVSARSYTFNITTTNSYDVTVSQMPNLSIEQQHTHLDIVEGNGASVTTPVDISIPYGCHLRLTVDEHARVTLDQVTAPLILIVNEGGIVNVYGGNCPQLDVTINGTGTVNMHNTQLPSVFKNVSAMGRFLSNTRPDLLTDRIAPRAPGHTTHSSGNGSRDITTRHIPFCSPDGTHPHAVVARENYHSLLTRLDSLRIYEDDFIGTALANSIAASHTTTEERDTLAYNLALRAMSDASQRTIVETNQGNMRRTYTEAVRVINAHQMYQEAWATLHSKLPRIAITALISGGIGGLIGTAASLKMNGEFRTNKLKTIGWGAAGVGIAAALSSAIYTISHFVRSRHHDGMEHVIDNLRGLAAFPDLETISTALRNDLNDFFTQLEDAPYNMHSNAAMHKRHKLVHDLYRTIKNGAVR